jgi:hypothetical protein
MDVMSEKSTANVAMPGVRDLGSKRRAFVGDCLGAAELFRKAKVEAASVRNDMSSEARRKILEPIRVQVTV